MSSNINGFLYEEKIINNLLQLGLSGVITEAAGASASAPDADMKVDGKIFNIEIKMNKNAQMGGTSIRWSDSKIKLVKQVDGEIEDLLIDAINNKKNDIINLLSFISEKQKEDFNTFPITCEKEIWELAAKKNLLVNAKIKYDSNFIKEHYAKKNIYYMQIGEAGLFYLKENPANLPIPELNGEIDIEIRTGRSGSKKLKDGRKVVGGGIRVQGRLKTKNKSPYTLENIESIKRLIFSK